MLINLTPVYAANKKVKMPERAVDGSRLINTSYRRGVYSYSIIAVADEKYIYYTTSGPCGFSGLDPASIEGSILKRNIKTGEEIVLAGPYSNINIYKNILLGTNRYYFYVEKISKTGKTKKLALGSSPIGIGNSIYYIGWKKAKVFYQGSYGPGYKGIGLYKMNVNGKRKELVKKGIDGWLGTSGKNLYYKYYDFYSNAKDNNKWINVKTGKPESSVILSYLYDPVSKTKFTFNEKKVKAGNYENGKWKYKTIFNYNKQSKYSLGILSVNVCGGKLLVQVDENTSAGENFGLYMMDLDGKNKMLLRRGWLGG